MSNQVALRRAAAKQGIACVDISTHVRSFYCGDDGLNFALTREGLSLLKGALAEWETFQWEVKLEGETTFSGDITTTPTFVSREIVKVGSKYYHELDKPEKIVAKLLNRPGDDTTFEERLAGIEVALVHTIILHLYGVRYDPVVEYLCEEFGTASRAVQLLAILE
jgi:hypothetical protein